MRLYTNYLLKVSTFFTVISIISCGNNELGKQPKSNDIKTINKGEQDDKKTSKCFSSAEEVFLDAEKQMGENGDFDLEKFRRTFIENVAVSKIDKKSILQYLEGVREKRSEELAHSINPSSKTTNAFNTNVIISLSKAITKYYAYEAHYADKDDCADLILDNLLNAKDKAKIEKKRNLYNRLSSGLLGFSLSSLAVSLILLVINSPIFNTITMAAYISLLLYYFLIYYSMHVLDKLKCDTLARNKKPIEKSLKKLNHLKTVDLAIAELQATITFDEKYNYFESKKGFRLHDS